jgi:hypothetical protein
MRTAWCASGARHLSAPSPRARARHAPDAGPGGGVRRCARSTRPTPFSGRLPGMANTALIGIAGVHHVISELSRQGMIALPTARNTAAYDVVVVSADGKKHANIQVKTSSKAVANFPMPAAKKIRTGPNDIYVLARWRESERRYECFLLTGREACGEVVRTTEPKDEARKRGHKSLIIPSANVGRNNLKNADLWREAWLNWRL